MASMKIIAIVVVAAVVVAGGAAAVFMLNNDDYYSDNSDCRLQILGNADKNDYLDSKDVDKINELIENKQYDLMADANHDDKVDAADAEFVKKLIDLKKSNTGKAAADKEKVTVYYITVDNKVQPATYPVNKMIIVNTQRALDLCINLGITDRIVALNDYIFDQAINVDTIKYKGFSSYPSVGDRKEPNLETITKTDADTIFAGTTGTYMKNISASAATYGEKTVLRLATWERGEFCSGALTLGFFTDADDNAQKYVKWNDKINEVTSDALAKVNTKATKMLNASSATWFGAQSDGVSTALTATGVTNIGNDIIVKTTGSGGSVTTYKENIVKANPSVIVLSYTVGYNWTQEQMDDKFNGIVTTMKGSIGATTAITNNNVCWLNYYMPFCLITMVGAKLMFPDAMSDVNVDKYIQEYLKDYCSNITDYTYNSAHFYRVAATA
ncbi:ABC-type Fe3+-hydroxamate transport system, periplasmic component [Thermoplasmatales archaeon BRNA1]|nr:ABC-type Fe3+-hydroxamate transport system, periplasmic component [Thermoplasmatales archaeon BRNA1]